MLASLRPSIGEILSILAPPPRHSPEKTPGFCCSIPSFANTDCIGGSRPPGAMLKILRRSRLTYHRAQRSRSTLSFSPPAILVHQTDGFVDDLSRHGERRATKNRLITRPH